MDGSAIPTTVLGAAVVIATAIFGWLKTRDATRFRSIDDQLAEAKAELTLQKKLLDETREKWRTNELVAVRLEERTQHLEIAGAACQKLRGECEERLKHEAALQQELKRDMNDLREKVLSVQGQKRAGR